MTTTLDQIRKRLMEGDPDTDENVEPKPLTGDAKLRADNPGLQELWEQYQTMLKLIKPAKKPVADTEADDILNQIRARQAGTPPTPKFKPRKLSMEERVQQLEDFMKQRSDHGE